VKTVDYAVFLLMVPFYIARDSVMIANFFVTYLPVRLLAVVRRVPYVYFVQDIESKFKSPGGLILNHICNWTYRDKRIVAANPHLQNRLRTEFGTRSRSICVGPETIFYDLPAATQKLYDVIYLLRKEPWKGVDRFKRFLARAEGGLSCLCISQDEQLRSVLEGSSAEFIKPQIDEELVRCFDSARVLLLTSYQEGFALPPLEAMARGVPTVLFRCGGPDQYIIDGVNGVYVESEEQAVSEIKSLTGDPSRYARLSEQARRTAAEFRMDKSLETMTEFIADCGNW
jgi:glycosyltransferase involved in cell wall biosynthesis